MPTVVLYKGKHRGEEFGDALHAGNGFSMTPMGYITTEEFCKCLHHFSLHRLSGKALLILVWHRAHLDPSVLIEAKSLTIQSLCLPAEWSHEQQLLHRSFFLPSFEILEWRSGQLQEGESLKRSSVTSVFKTIYRSLNESFHPTICSSWVQIYRNLPI
jgi:hypothetical protein